MLKGNLAAAGRTSVSQLARNASQALETQEAVDVKIEHQPAALESTVIAVGDEVGTVQWQLQLRCHAAFKSICVASAPYDSSQWEWNKIRSHLLGLWQHTNFSLDLHNLHQKNTRHPKCLIGYNRSPRAGGTSPGTS